MSTISENETARVLLDLTETPETDGAVISMRIYLNGNEVFTISFPAMSLMGEIVNKFSTPF